MASTSTSRGGRGGRGSRGGRGGKGNGSTPYDKSNQQAKPAPAPKERPEDELLRLLSDEPRGTDCGLLANDRGNQKCTILVSDSASYTIFKDLQYRFDHYSQNPTLVISKSAYSDGKNTILHEIIIGSEQMVMVDRSVDRTVLREYIDKSEQTDVTTTAALQRMHVPTLAQEDLQYLAEKHSGFAAFGWQIKENDKNPLVVYSPKSYTLPDIHELRSMIGLLRRGRRITVVRANNFRHREIVDKHWCSRLGPVFLKGIYPDFEPFEQTTIKTSDSKEEPTSNLQQWLDGTKDIPQLPWMQMPEKGKANEETDEATKEKTFGKLTERKHFTSIQEYHIIFALALLIEMQYQIKVFDRVFNGSNRHRATVARKAGTVDMWNFTVELSTPEDFTLPKIPDGTRFQFRQVRDVDMDSAESTGPEEAYRMQKISIGHIKRGSLVLQWVAKKDSVYSWAEDDKLDISLSMEFNREPTARAFRSLQTISELPRCNLTEMLLGRSYDKFQQNEPLADKVKRLNRVKLEALGKLLDERTLHKNLNLLQWQAFDLPLFGLSGMSFLQGPPGTGKSLVMSWLAVIANIIDIPVIISAPSGAATQAVAEKVVEQIKFLQESQSILTLSVKLTLFPTKKVSECLAMEALGQCTVTEEYTNPVQEKLMPYQWWRKVVDTAVREARSGRHGDKYDQWLKHYESIQRKEVLPAGQWRYFFNRLEEFVSVINSQTTILISTCNNLDRLKSGYEDFLGRIKNDGMVVVDEAGFDQEYSACIPASLTPRMIYLVGDHRQLEPIVASAAVNILTKQSRLSIFERHVEHRDVEFVALKATYRLPRRLADILGVLSGYVGLLTVKEEIHDNLPTWRAYNTWFMQSGYHQLRRTSPVSRNSEAFISLPRDARRVFLNVRGSSGKSPSSMSTVNYANINAICDYVTDMAREPAINSKVVVQVPFAAQKDELEEQFLIRDIFGIEVKTIDSFQGGEEDIIVLDITAANESDPAFIGFLSKWNRMNVALSRPKCALVIIGNLDLWRTRIGRLFSTNELFAYFILDIVERGDIVDIEEEDVNTRLPKDKDEIASGEWSLEQPPSQLKETGKVGVRDTICAARTRTHKYADTFSSGEITILDKLDKLRVSASISTKEVKKAARDAAKSGKCTTMLTDLVKHVLDTLDDHPYFESLVCDAAASKTPDQWMQESMDRMEF